MKIALTQPSIIRIISQAGLKGHSLYILPGYSSSEELFTNYSSRRTEGLILASRKSVSGSTFGYLRSTLRFHVSGVLFHRTKARTIISFKLLSEGIRF